MMACKRFSLFCSEKGQTDGTRLAATLWSPNSFLWFALPYNRAIPMKAYVYVSLKRSVLDPQGKTIEGSLRKMGYQGLQDVRQGKFFELTLEGSLDRSQAEAEVGRIARDVLTNPVIEEFRYSIEE
jgi:phosphoribosylformylglycinamidine synthase